MKHILYFLIGLIITPFAVISTIYRTGRDAIGMFIEGYKKGVKKNDKKNNPQGEVRSSPEEKSTEH